MHEESVLEYYKNMADKIGKHWNDFISYLKSKADPNDQS